MSKIAYILKNVLKVPSPLYEELTPEVEKALTKYEITSPEDISSFLATVSVESGNFRYKAEIWGNTTAQARYDTRTDLGNTPEIDGDGFKNRGSGFIQITGKANLDLCAEALGIPKEEIAESLRTNNSVALESAAWFYTKFIPLDLRLSGNITQISGIINCGSPKCTANNLSERVSMYSKIYGALINYKEESPLESRRIGGAILTTTGAVLQQIGDTANIATSTAKSVQTVSETIVESKISFKVLGGAIFLIGIILIVKSWVDRNNK
jgi:putative chitinase